MTDGWHDEDAPRVPPLDVAPSPVVRPGPDAERDARIEVYRDRERRRAARALDRYFTAMHSDSDGSPFVAGERFVEQVGDYVLARLQVPMEAGDLRGESFIGDPMTVGEAYDRLHQKANYGVSPGCVHYGCQGNAECQNESMPTVGDWPAYPHPYIEGDDYICVRCGALPSDLRHAPVVREGRFGPEPA